MKSRIKSALLAFSVTLPIVFALLFFGYFPVQYQVVLHTDNIVGEGICQTYVCPTAGYAAFYKIQFYFGSELKKATIRSYHYDVKQIEFVTSDVSEFDITGLDSYIKGIHLGHFEPEDILPEGETVEGTKAILSSSAGVLHVDVLTRLRRNCCYRSAVHTCLILDPYFACILLIAALLAIPSHLSLREFR